MGAALVFLAYLLLIVAAPALYATITATASAAWSRACSRSSSPLSRQR